MSSQVKVETFGSANHYLIPDSTNFDMIMSLDFFFDDGAIDKMADAIVELPMFGINKSLNVMVSLGIVLYQVIEKNTN